MVDILTLSFTIENEKKLECPYLSRLVAVFPSTYRVGTVSTLVSGCFRICSSWAILHTELFFLKQTFLKNGFPENSIDTCFQRFMNNIYVVKETTLAI